MTENEALIKRYLLGRAKEIMKAPRGKLKHPFFDPGSGYAGEQWDWDSCFEGQSFFTAFDIFPKIELTACGISREQVEQHAKGCILNFLDAQEDDGYIPILVCDGGLFEGYFASEHKKGEPMNPAKLVCFAACNTCRFLEDFSWLDGEKLIAYLDYFEKNLYDEATGLFFFQDDIMVGIDNNPTVFFRNPRSCADIFLNCVMYEEYCSAATILAAQGNRRGEELLCRAEKLKAAVNREMWDEHDGLYYSQDLTRYQTEKKVKELKFHSGLYPSWHATPLKIRFWGCFLPMWAGICTREQAQRMCRHLQDGDDIFAAYGIRTCAKTEKMYSLKKSSNPSNWLGPVWVLANVLVWQGLQRYEQRELAAQLREATLELLGKNLREHGEMYESYNPDTGEPMLHPGFLSHNMPVLEMLREIH